MKLALVLAIALAVPILLAPTAAAWPPVCIVREVGDEGGKLYAEVWLTCQVQATVTTCPRDGFCKTVSTDDLLS